MENIFLADLAKSVDSVSGSRFLFILLFGVIGGLVYSNLFRFLKKGQDYNSLNHYAIFVLFPVTLSTFFFVLKSSLPLSLGLLGAMSIIRFRTTVSDIRESFLLLSSIAFSLLVGAEMFKLSLMFLLFVMVTVYVTYFFLHRKAAVLLTITHTQEAGVNQYLELLKSFDIISKVVADGKVTLTCLCFDEVAVEDFLKNANGKTGFLDVSYVKQN